MSVYTKEPRVRFVPLLFSLPFSFYFLAGVPIRHGGPEGWKITAEEIGRTKPSRAPDKRDKRQRTDGRPPDTARELLTQTKLKLKTPRSYQSFPWSRNSCWLDASLELIVAAVFNHFDDFSACFAGISGDRNSLPLWKLHELLRLRKVHHGTLGDATITLHDRFQNYRDGFRAYLLEQRIILTIDGFDGPFVSLPSILCTGLLAHIVERLG